MIFAKPLYLSSTLPCRRAWMYIGVLSQEIFVLSGKPSNDVR